jgi:hypothetical protein
MQSGKYRAVLASIRAIGLVEPLVVHPNKGRERHATSSSMATCASRPSRELGHTTPSASFPDDDAFTYNDKVNRLSLIQEHRMIMKALEGGVTEEQIAKALEHRH